MIISGILYDACGPLPSVRIVFEADRTTLNGVISTSRCDVVTQGDGSYSIDLEAGYYRVAWFKQGRAIYLGTIVAGDDGEMTLPQALEASPTPVTPSEAEDFLAQMRAEADRAEAKADTAVAAADSAQATADQIGTFGVNAIIVLTQADYDDIETPDPETLYIIEEA